MSSDSFHQTTPEATDFTPLVSQVSQLLGSDLETRIRNDLNPLQSTSASKSSEEEHTLSAHDDLVTIIDDVKEAKKELNALRRYVEAAEEYTQEHLTFHSALKTYFERTTDALALRAESMSPIRRLPNDVLQLIFLDVHAQSTETERYNPVTAQVCTSWRRLAEATPLLWTTINVNLLPGRQDDMGAVAQMETRIQRAGQHLVALRLSPEDDPVKHLRGFLEALDSDVEADSDSRTQGPAPITKAEQRDRLFKAAITTLLRYTDRIISLHITHHEDSLGGYFVERCAAENITFEHLRTLSVYGGHYGSSDFDDGVLLKACPKINRLRMYEVPDTPYIRWETMKEFKGSLDAAGLSAFLSRAQDIEQAQISSRSWSSIPDITFSASRLTSLSLNYVDLETAAHIATTQRPSSLRHLSLSCPYDAASILLDSWGPDLEFLALESDIMAKDLKDLLPATPNLRALRIHGDRATPPSLFNLLPKLTHIEIRAGFDEVSEERVRRTLARPLRHTSRGNRLPLRSVTFLPRDPIHFSTNSPKYWHENESIWESVYQDLKAVDIDVHEYRGVKSVDIDGRTFNTAFFEERR